MTRNGCGRLLAASERHINSLNCLPASIAGARRGFQLATVGLGASRLHATSVLISPLALVLLSVWPCGLDLAERRLSERRVCFVRPTAGGVDTPRKISSRGVRRHHHVVTAAGWIPRDPCLARHGGTENHSHKRE